MHSYDKFTAMRCAALKGALLSEVVKVVYQTPEDLLFDKFPLGSPVFLITDTKFEEIFL